jgi:hypothetical protein
MSEANASEANASQANASASFWQKHKGKIIIGLISLIVVLGVIFGTSSSVLKETIKRDTVSIQHGGKKEGM